MKNTTSEFEEVARFVLNRFLGVGVNVGGDNSKLNLAKIREAREILLKSVNLTPYPGFIGVTNLDYIALLLEEKVNSGLARLNDAGKVEVLGFQVIRMDTLLEKGSPVCLPIWLESYGVVMTSAIIHSYRMGSGDTI